MYNLAFVYLMKGRQTKSPAHFREAARLFSTVLHKDPSKVEPYFYLGMLYENGLGVDQDHTTTLRYYKKAASLGYVKGYTKCGDLLYSGKGCGKRDKSEAIRCYQRAA